MDTPSVSNVFRKKKKTDKEGYLYLRIGIPGQHSPEFKSYGIKIHQDQWDAENEIIKRSHKDAVQLNAKLQQKKAEVVKMLEDAPATPNRERIQEKINKKSYKGSFIDFYADHVNLIEKRNSKRYHIHFDTNFRQFREAMGADIQFEDISVKLLEKYEASLKVNSTTLHVKMRKLREVINKAIRRGLIQYAQIDGYSWPKYKAPHKDYLTLEQTEVIANKLYEGGYDYDPGLRTIAAFFLVECYGGIRYSDWSRFEVEKRVHNEGMKIITQKTNTGVYLPFSKFPRLEKIINYIREHNLKFTFTVQYTNRELKHSIGKNDLKLKFPLTTHVGRHTCATLLGEMRYSTRTIGKILGISEKTAATYIKDTDHATRYEIDTLGGL